MKNYLYSFYFYRNGQEEKYDVLASSELIALEIFYSNHPEYKEFELIKTESVETKI